MGARVIYTHRCQRSEIGLERHNLDCLLGASDAVLLHLPLMPQTEAPLSVMCHLPYRPGSDTQRYTARQVYRSSVGEIPTERTPS